MTRLLLALFLLFGCSEDRPEELVIMNTVVCVDGVFCLSVVKGLECDYIPIEINGKKVRCEDE